MHTSQLSIERRPESADQGLIRGGGDGDRCRTEAVWRPPPGKRGIALHAALVGRPCSCIRRLAGRRAQEVRFTRFLRNRAVTAGEMVWHAAAGTAARGAGRGIVVGQDKSELILGGAAGAWGWRWAGRQMRGGGGGREARVGRR